MNSTLLAVRLQVAVGMVLLFALTGCVGYVDGGYGGGAVVVAQPDVYLFGGGYYGGGHYDHGRDVHGYSQRGADSRAASVNHGGGHAASVGHGGGGDRH